MRDDALGADEVAALLRRVHGSEAGELEALAGGFWSSAFGYRVGDRALVLRLGTVPEGFEMDRTAMAFSGPGLPVPDVLEIGEGLGRAYAISVRHHGRFLESVRPDEADVAGPTIVALLGALRSVAAEPGVASAWYPPGVSPDESTWRTWLTAGLVDDPSQRVSGWRATLAADPELDRLFRGCEERIHELLEVCPERRDLVHGDLLHGNVLVAEDASAVTAVFSWKCSVRRDFFFDLAWCTFWSAWHPGVAAADLWGRAIEEPSLTEEDLADAALRHHCYELQIGASHLGWCAWTGNQEELRAVTARTTAILERGPLEMPAVPSEDPPTPFDRVFAAGAQAEGYVGRSEEAARARAEEEGVGQVRVITWDGGRVGVHADHRPTRLNLLVKRGTVLRAAFF